VAICEWEIGSALLKYTNEVSVLLGCNVSILDDWYRMLRHSTMVLSHLKKWYHHATLKHSASSSYEAPHAETTEVTTANLYSLYQTYISDWPRAYQCHVHGRPLACSRSTERVFGLKIFTLNRKELNWIYILSMNLKQVNTLDIEQVRELVHTYSSSWYNTTKK
jgi:hypothetical protein